MKQFHSLKTCLKRRWKGATRVFLVSDSEQRSLLHKNEQPIQRNNTERGIFGPVSTNSSNTSGGFSLVEALVTVGILGITSTGMWQMYVNNLKAQKSTEYKFDRVELTRLLSQIDCAQTLGIDNLGTDVATFCQGDPLLPLRFSDGRLAWGNNNDVTPQGATENTRLMFGWLVKATCTKNSIVISAAKPMTNNMTQYENDALTGDPLNWQHKNAALFGVGTLPTLCPGYMDQGTTANGGENFAAVCTGKDVFSRGYVPGRGNVCNTSLAQSAAYRSQSQKKDSLEQSVKILEGQVGDLKKQVDALWTLKEATKKSGDTFGLKDLFTYLREERNTRRTQIDGFKSYKDKGQGECPDFTYLVGFAADGTKVCHRTGLFAGIERIDGGHWMNTFVQNKSGNALAPPPGAAKILIRQFQSEPSGSSYLYYAPTGRGETYIHYFNNNSGPGDPAKNN